MKVKVGDSVAFRRGNEFSRRKLLVNKVYSNGKVQLKFIGGGDKGETVGTCNPEELFKVTKNTWL
ncbi:MAG: hypothetical protein Q7R52_02485 [archaeon]|nr:hypothetical protein [archaeon]